MEYLLLNVVIHKVTATGEIKKIPSLLFSNTLDIEQAKKLAAFHIYHLHTNNQQVLPTINSVMFNQDDFVEADPDTKISFDLIKRITPREVHGIGKLGLFGYNKKLSAVQTALI